MKPGDTLRINDRIFRTHSHFPNKSVLFLRGDVVLLLSFKEIDACGGHELVLLSSRDGLVSVLDHGGLLIASTRIT